MSDSVEPCGWRRRRGLTWRVLVGVVSVVAAVSLVVAMLTAQTVRTLLMDRLELALTSAEARSVRALERGLLLQQSPGQQPGRPTSSPGTAQQSAPPPPWRLDEPPTIQEVRGQEVGTITAHFVGEGSEREGVGQVIDADGTLQALDEVVLLQLSNLEPGMIHELRLTGLGEYRAQAGEVGGVTVVTALSTASVEQTISSVWLWGALFALLGMGAAGAASAVLVRRELAPLREVAGTAFALTETDLSSGEVEVPRVPSRLTGFDDEVGQVARALDAALGHVDESLEVRHRSEQQVRQFVADASHELRTPLATVLGYSDLALRPDADSDVQVAALEKVRTEGRRMQALVEDLLLLARLDQGRPLAQAEVDLTRLVLESVSDAQVTAPEHLWRLDLPDEPVMVDGDEARLHQVITNLLTNAARHTPEGTTVTTSVLVSGGRVRVRVRDDGPGIPATLLPEVFTRFARGDSARTRATSGAGLGLSLARSIARAHGGDLTVSSRPGETTFEVGLPA